MKRHFDWSFVVPVLILLICVGFFLMGYGFGSRVSARFEVQSAEPTQTRSFFHESFPTTSKLTSNSTSTSTISTQIETLSAFEDSSEADIFICEPMTYFEPNESDVELIAKVLYNEARGLSELEQSAVAWCILNRVDSDEFPNTIEEVVTQPDQFAYDYWAPVMEKQYYIAKDVLSRWLNSGYGRTLPSDYLYFVGDGYHNYFTKEWQSDDCWNWDCDNPY